MDVVTLEEDGRIRLPEAVRQRLGLCPGSRLVVEEGTGGQTLALHVLADDLQLVEQEGIWVFRSHHPSTAADAADGIIDFREERLASLAPPP